MINNTSKYQCDFYNFKDFMDWVRDYASINIDSCGNEWYELSEGCFEMFYNDILKKEREAIIDLVAFHGSSVEIETAIRARGQI